MNVQTPITQNHPHRRAAGVAPRLGRGGAAPLPAGAVPRGRRASARRRAAADALRHRRPLRRSGRAAIDIEKGLERPRDAWVLARGDVEEVAPRAGEAGGQRQRPRPASGPPVPDRSQAVPRQGRRGGHPAGLRPRRDHHARDGVRRHPREPAPRGGRRGDPRRRGLRRLDPRLRHPRVRPRRGGPRPRHHPGQHQPRRAGADGHRPQLPGQDQRQHRQLGGAVAGRGRGRQDGLGDPLGRRHHHGPLHRPQHPQHPRVDHPQLPDAARHRADLPGAGEGRTASPRT